jgi:NADH-quinone oxidoreductase subunit D
MASSSVEFTAADTPARADQALDRLQETGELLGEKLTLNMGPSHPATHGVLGWCWNSTAR